MSAVYKLGDIGRGGSVEYLVHKQTPFELDPLGDTEIVQPISELWCYVVETGLTVNDSSCHVKNRLHTADLIFLYSRVDAITVVDTTDDKRVDEYLCSRCRQRAPDEFDTTKMVEA